MKLVDIQDNQSDTQLGTRLTRVSFVPVSSMTEIELER